MPTAPVPQRERPLSEKPVHHKEEWPPIAATRESLLVAMRTNAVKKINKLILKKRKKLRLKKQEADHKGLCM